MVSRLRRLRPRFTLWAMLVVITVVAIPLGYVAQRRSWNLRRLAAYEQFRQMYYGLDETWSVTNQTSRPSDDAFAASGAAEVPKWTVQGWWNDMCLESATPQISSIEVGPFSEDWPFDPQNVLLQLALFPELTELWIQDGKGIDDRCLASLESLNNLRSFYLWRAPDVRGEFLSHLRNSKLETLSLQDLPALDHIPNLVSLTNLTKLELELCDNLNDESLRAVEMPSSLKTLRVSSSGIGDATLSRWLKSTKLENLSLEASVTRAIAAALAMQTELRKLRIHDSPLRDEDLAFLSSYEHLESLELNAMPICGDFLKHLPDKLPLESVDFSQTLVTDENVSELARHRNLRHLRLAFSPVTGEFANVKPLWPRLEMVDLRGAQFSEQGKAALKNLISTRARINLPENWTLVDFAALQVHREQLKSLVVPAQLAGWAQREGVNWYASESEDWKINRCSDEVMAPVLRLHELAREPKKE